MAKRTTIPRRWRWSRTLGAAWLALLAVPNGLLMVRAGDLPPSTSPSPASALAHLDYQETAYSINNESVSLSRQSAVFKHEPAGITGKVIRGTLNFGDGTGNAIPFLWQRDAGKLFLDLNRNQDLTDDPAGVFSTRVTAPLNFQNQTFTNVHLIFSTPWGPSPVLADLDFWDYGASLGCTMSARSFWQGKLALSGQDWQVGVVPTTWFGNNGHREVSLDHGRLLLRPWEKRNQAFSAINGSLDTVPFSQKLFFGGQAYQLNWLPGPSDSNKPGPDTGLAKRPALPTALQFVEQSVPQGELKITGKYIHRLTLSGTAGSPWLTVLDQPAATVHVPTGSYSQPNVVLEQNGVQAYCNPNSWPVRQVSLLVSGQTPATLDIGGPLTNSVAVARHGSDLTLNYQLLGAGGQRYQLASVNRQHPPEFAIFHGGKKIASGDFEFG